MATGTQVPWTDPGGTPCCCDSCPTNEDGPDAIHSPNTYQNIQEADYASLIAGGTFTLDVAINVEGTSSEGALFTPPFVETATANLTNVPLQTRSAVSGSLPCYNQLVPTTQLFTSNQLVGGGLIPPPPPDQKALGINFTYALATVSGTKRISLANAQNSQAAGENLYVAEITSLGFDLPDLTRLTVSDPAFVNPLPLATGISATVQLVMPQATYSASSLARVVYFYAFGLTPVSLTGSISVIVHYSPSAP